MARRPKKAKTVETIRHGEAKRTNTPLVWLPFAAGGMIAAFVIPVLAYVTGIAAPMGFIFPYAFTHERLYPVIAHPFARLVLAGLFIPVLWHAAHRFRLLLHDFGIWSDRGKRITKRVCYFVASVASVVFLLALVVL